jgi:cell division protein FtsW
MQMNSKSTARHTRNNINHKKSTKNNKSHTLGTGGTTSAAKSNYKLNKKQPSKVNKEVINIGNLDSTVLLVVILLLLVSIIMVFSAGLHWSIHRINDTFFLLRRQIIFVILGFFTMIFTSYFNYRALINFAIPSYIFVNILLIITMLFGNTRQGATRSITIPIINMEMQPLELAKISIILAMSYIIVKNKGILKTWSGFAFVSFVLGIKSFFVWRGGGLSSAIIVSIIGFSIIFVASPYIARFVVAAIMSLLSLTIYIAVFDQGFRGARFNAWLDPFAHRDGVGMQIVNSLYAIASGGAFGVGIGQSVQRGFIPEAFTDFIFAIIIEELGFVGAGIIMFLFVVLIWRGIMIAINSPDLFGSLLATGIVTMIASQTVIHIAVVTNSMPNTGIPLPFISYGGTSLIVTMFLMGVLLNISRYSKQ